MNANYFLGAVIAISLVGWFLAGALVYSLIDDDEQHLFQWAQTAPHGFYILTIMLWPVVALWWMFARRKQ